ncbi:unnamed protein product [Brachionus calyciflorus]|uniref:RRM domain-containing protein n=1 Tax=Brachionus calyciflorus TaxID=104777 RepID=A0A813Z7S2_9BILA|nr:unnamed protein product [Brachionus calyciflorus]
MIFLVESKQVVVTNLNKNENLSTIEYYFKTVGQIDKIERNTNNWIITYNDDDSAIDAVVCYNNQKINGNQIQVSFLKKIEPNFNESKKSKRPLTALTPSSSSENVSDLDLIKCLDEFETPKRLCIDKIRQNSVEIVESTRGVNSETHPIILNNYTPDVSGNPEYPIVLSNSEPEKHYSKKLAKKIVYEDDCTEEEDSERDESEEEEDDEDESDNEDEYDSEIYTNESYSNEYYEEYMSDYYDDSYDIDAYIDHCYYINERMAYNNYHYPTVLSTHYIYQNRNNSKSNTIQVQESKSNDDILLELSLYELIHQNARDETSKILNEKTSKSSKSVIVEESDSFVLSLICPITKTRLDNPGRGEECKHLECFNIKAYMQMNQKQNLRIDILKQFDKDVIELKKVDNVWKPYEKNFENNLVFIELS